MTLLFLSIAAAVLWLIVLLLPWRPWSVSEALDSTGDKLLPAGIALTVLIPARNEEKNIEKTLLSVKKQGQDIRIIVVDDCSRDNTAAVAEGVIGTSGTVIRGMPLPPGWSGKLWALEQGLSRVNTRLVLLLDADIVLKPGILAAALNVMKENGLDFLSLMARLRMNNLYERLFMPAFIYFFKLIYPFRLSNRPGHFVAAAAGGFIITRTEVLRKVNAFESIRNALIDDCTLASRVKAAGFITWIGLTRSVVSMRAYDRLNDIWHMVERTAFTQLRYSWLLLILVTAVMALSFLMPVAGLMSLNPEISLLSLAALLFMCITYLPVLRYYDQPAGLTLTLPLTALLYMAMTWSSAIRHLTGKGTGWKGRLY